MRMCTGGFRVPSSTAASVFTAIAVRIVSQSSDCNLAICSPPARPRLLLLTSSYRDDLSTRRSDKILLRLGECLALLFADDGGRMFRHEDLAGRCLSIPGCSQIPESKSQFNFSSIPGHISR